MARPPAGAPPVDRSAVRQESAPRRDLQVYGALAQELRREDRVADLRALLGSDELVERFISVAMHALSNNSDLLLNADPVTIIMAIKDAAALGLDPTGLAGEGWIIRYNRTATFQAGWRGYVKRIRNSHKVQDIDCQVVYENDTFDYGFTEKGGWFRHVPVRPVKGDVDDGFIVKRGDYWGVYAYAVMPSGFVELEVMTEADVNDVRDKFSKAEKANTPWSTSWSEMARKTVIRRLAKRLPQEAVDQLLIQETKNEALAAGGPESSAPAQDTTAARRAALRAVGAELPALEPGEQQGPSEGQVDATVDGNAVHTNGTVDDSAHPAAAGEDPAATPSYPLAGEPPIPVLPFDDAPLPTTDPN